MGAMVMIAGDAVSSILLNCREAMPDRAIIHETSAWFVAGTIATDRNRVVHLPLRFQSRKGEVWTHASSLLTIPNSFFPFLMSM